MFLFSILSAVIPTLLIIYYFDTSDKYPEPWRYLIATFALGVATVIPIFIFGYFARDYIVNLSDPVFRAFSISLFLAAIPEELLKFAVVFFFCLRLKAFDEPMDGLVYGVTASLGFATFENIMYVMNGGILTSIARAITAVPSHAIDGAIMGYYLAQWKFSGKNKSYYLFMAIFGPILLHFTYDFILFLMDAYQNSEVVIGNLFLTFIGFIIIQFRWGYKLTQKVKYEQ